jgi:hypothetical protein
MNEQNIDWNAELKRTKEYVEKESDARAALRTLVEGGCKETWILLSLFLYCGGAPNLIRSTKNKLRWLKNRMDAVSGRLLKDADDIELVTAFLSSDLDVDFTADTGLLRAYANILRRLSDVVVKDTGSFRKSGRDQHLRFLHEGIVRATGRDHYRELAALADAVALGYGNDIKFRSAEDIGKLIRRTAMLDLASELNEIPSNDRRKRLPNRKPNPFNAKSKP